MAYTKAEIEALKNALLASNQPITASIHRTFAQKIIDELYDAQSRGNLLGGVQASGTTGTEDSVLVIRSGQAYLIPASLFGGSGITLADLNGVVIIDPQDGDLIAYDAVSETWNNIPLAFVPYTGATANVDLGAFNLTAAALIKDGGVSSQFLKADGSVDNNNYLTANDLPSTLSLYATNVAAAVMGYFKLVNSIDDPDYNTVPVDVPTGAITGAEQLIASLISPVNLINGNPGVFNVTTTGNITRTAGSGTAEFYFEIYKRDAGGTETLVGTSGNTIPVLNAGYSEFFATAIWNDGIFGVTDAIVLKFYANRIVGGSDPSYQFQFGGDQPVRTIVPVPLAVIPNIYLEELADVEDGAASDADGIFWDATAEIWKYKSLAENGAVTITDVQTITGAKTFNNELLALTGSNPILRLASTSNTSALDFRNVFGEDKASVLLSNPLNKLSVITRTDNADIEIAPHGTGSILLPNVSAGTGDVLMLNGSNEVVKGTSGTSKWSDLGADIYRNSRALIGGTAFSSSIPKFEVIGGDAFINVVRIGRGGGNINTNTAIGASALFSNTTGIFNTTTGDRSLFSNTTGNYNTANGLQALFSNTTGISNAANGLQALFSNTTGSYNTANGDSALYSNTTGANNTANGSASGRFLPNKITEVTILNNSVMLGYRTSPLADNQTNQIVIGHDANGAGSNTVTLGNTSIIKTILRGTVNMAGLPISSTGLVTGDVWNNGGVLNIV